ncbi:MAG: hypothetical protein V9E94_04680 [Microthrixaceae bacterium]
MVLSKPLDWIRENSKDYIWCLELVLFIIDKIGFEPEDAFDVYTIIKQKQRQLVWANEYHEHAILYSLDMLEERLNIKNEIDQNKYFLDQYASLLDKKDKERLIKFFNQKPGSLLLLLKHFVYKNINNIEQEQKKHYLLDDLMRAIALRVVSAPLALSISEWTNIETKINLCIKISGYHVHWRVLHHFMVVKDNIAQHIRINEFPVLFEKAKDEIPILSNLDEANLISEELFFSLTKEMTVSINKKSFDYMIIYAEQYLEEMVDVDLIRGALSNLFATYDLLRPENPSRAMLYILIKKVLSFYLVSVIEEIIYPEIRETLLIRLSAFHELMFYLPERQTLEVLYQLFQSLECLFFVEKKRTNALLSIDGLLKKFTDDVLSIVFTIEKTDKLKTIDKALEYILDHEKPNRLLLLQIVLCLQKIIYDKKAEIFFASILFFF